MGVSDPTSIVLDICTVYTVSYVIIMDIQELAKWKKGLEAEAHALKDKIQLLTAELQQKRQQIELISQLIRATDSTEEPSTFPPIMEGNSSVAVTPTQVLDRVCGILAEARRPMNINEIRTEFVRRGYPIPGKGTAFNILVHISRDLKLGKESRFVRAGKGTYSLRNSSRPSKGRVAKSGN